MYIQLAWRNLWRNPKRTVVILIAIVLGVWSMIVVSGFAQGFVESSIRSSISRLTGHLQIHHPAYRSDPVIDHRIPEPESVTKILQSTLPEDSHWSLRMRVSGIINTARHSSGITFVGIEPEAESNVSFIGSAAVTRGRYLRTGDTQGILLGEALAEQLETDLGKRVVLMSQDTTGEIASRAFTVTGIFEAAMESTEQQFVFVTRPAAGEMLKAGTAVSEIAVLLPERRAVTRVADDLREALDTASVHTWEQLLPLLKTYLEVLDGFLYLMFIVVFIAMGFGIVNTILMAVLERVREFGLFNALGMKTRSIIKEVMIESGFLLIIGVALGNLLGMLTVSGLAWIGIDLSAFAKGSEFIGMSRVIYPALKLQDMLMANLVVLILGLLVSLYPAIKATRFNPVDTLTRL